MKTATQGLFGDSLTVPKDELMRLIEKHCTLKVIQELLRKYKTQYNEILISGIKELVVEHLAAAVARNMIPHNEAAQLLNHAEENGHQHIFFFKPKTEAIQLLCNNMQQVGSLLFADENWKTNMGFPKFYITPKDFKWADLRRDSEFSPYTWRLKLYHGNEQNVFLRAKTKGKITRKIYELQYIRDVYIVRWNKYNILEIRIPTFGMTSKHQIQSGLDNIWRILSPALMWGGFEPLNIKNILSNIIKEQHHGLRFTGAQFMDTWHGTARFEAADPEDELDSAPDRKKAMDLFSDCKTAVGFWKFDEKEHELRTEICQLSINDLRIGSSATSEAIDYVISKLFAV